MPVSARRLVKKLRGGAQSHLLECDDSHYYVVKFLNNPQHRRILINEWISGVLLKHLQIFTPDCALVRITEDFIQTNPELTILRGAEREPAMPGIHFGSRMSVNPDRVATYDFLPDPLLNKVENMVDFAGALVFDKWISNADSRQAVFFRAKAKTWTPIKGEAPARAGFFAQMIDHGFAFNGPHWQFPETPLHGIYHRTVVYAQVTSLDSFQPWLDMVKSFPVEVIDEAWKQIPPAWLDGDREELEATLEKLLRRRSRVEDLIFDIHKNRPAIFPNWA